MAAHLLESCRDALVHNQVIKQFRCTDMEFFRIEFCGQEQNRNRGSRDVAEHLFVLPALVGITEVRLFPSAGVTRIRCKNR